MSEYIVNFPKKALKLDTMEYNPPHHHHQDKTNSGALHVQECTHMINTVFLLFPVLRKKKKKKEKRKVHLPTLPIFRPKGQTNLLLFKPYVKIHITIQGYAKLCDKWSLTISTTKK